MQETRVQSLVWEVPLGKKMATHPSILAWKILWTEEPGVIHSMELQRAKHKHLNNNNKIIQNKGRSEDIKEGLFKCQ